MTYPGSLSIREVTWNGPDGDDVRHIRRRVFVEEQEYPEECEWEDADADGARHFLAFDKEGRAIAVARLVVVDGTPPAARIGRLAVLKERRGQGAGSAIMEAAIARARELGFRRLVLSSQTHALNFYERLGFHATAPEHMEVGHPHRWMERMLDTKGPE